MTPGDKKKCRRNVLRSTRYEGGLPRTRGRLKIASLKTAAVVEEALKLTLDAKKKNDVVMF
ncbi:uncharacterized protein PHALS_07450 [Plasmopara halstedii]|uniref:Uncharacterized protein n=1 Tax=Plasmopara halstedii TaxID=4781 RepID=A0A0P1B714_PLAHL|nr:uncharacterized protein PHALS_07450 [Plasmopara halstedii]CEG49698.1 hypothetical protein PHALS_07450 [Plasmopara halstedii]|eukprot:XP_024586067.1 hypothetical protein PHALS_07450 [Plasmopara halstedii]